MMRPLPLLLACLMLIMPSPHRSSALAQSVLQEGQHPFPATDESGYAYQLFLPRGYLGSEDRWPLLIFLHGSGERGDDIRRVTGHGPPKVVARRPGFPFVTLSPQLSAGEDWSTARLERLLDHIQHVLRLDPSRIDLTGLSRGGHAAWLWASERPDLFAAVVPVSGRGDPTDACRLADAPVWAFHGDSDPIVDPAGSFAMIEAIRNCNAQDPARLTLYPAPGHDAWTATYDDPALYLWLLEHRRDRDGTAL